MRIRDPGIFWPQSRDPGWEKFGSGINTDFSLRFKRTRELSDGYLAMRVPSPSSVQSRTTAAAAGVPCQCCYGTQARQASQNYSRLEGTWSNIFCKFNLGFVVSYHLAIESRKIVKFTIWRKELYRTCTIDLYKAKPCALKTPHIIIYKIRWSLLHRENDPVLRIRNVYPKTTKQEMEKIRSCLTFFLSYLFYVGVRDFTNPIFLLKILLSSCGQSLQLLRKIEGLLSS